MYLLSILYLLDYNDIVEMDICPFKDVYGLNCQGSIPKDDVNRVILTQEKAIDKINANNKKRGTNISVDVGSVVHKKCRERFNNQKYIDSYKRKNVNEEKIAVKRLRSNNSQDFKYASHCLFCESIAVDENSERHKKVHRVSTWNCQNKIVLHCNERGDKWATEVNSRIKFAIDLPAKDALYHKQCSDNFRTGRYIPIKFRKPSDDDEERRHVGRPTDEVKRDAFENLMDDFENNDETITVKELIERMGTMCETPYSYPKMISKLSELENILISRKGKEQNIVTSKLSASKVLKNFHLRKESITGEDEDVWKREIIYTAARLIRAEIDEVKEDRIFYPDISDIGIIEKQINYVPFYLRTFLREIFTHRKTDMETRIAAIGQSIMQQHRPRSLMAPMQFALTMKAHDDCPGLINDLFKSGFCLSGDEAILFKTCAASDSPDPFSLMRGKFGHIIGDNFDHNKITLTGHDTIHVMGLMVTENPSRDPPHRITRSSRDFLKQKPESSIQIKDIRKMNKSNLKIIYNSLPDILVEDHRKHLDLIWKISLAYKPEKIGWQGYMTAITDGYQKGKSSFHFLPMVDLDPNSWKCIYSVLTWGLAECKKHDIVPIFTFDQPIWWNARQIKSQESDLAEIVLNLGAFHTDLSFLGSIGNIMKSSGLKQILALVYPENTVNHMLSGKAYYRAMRGYFLVDAALNIFIIKKYMSTEDQNINHTLEKFKESLENLDEGKAMNDEILIAMSSIFEDIKEELKAHPTGELWIQFMDIVDLIRESHRAQRTSHFMLYLKSLQKRLPYFPASGHNNYAKSGYIFLQDMIALKDTNPEAYKLFSDGLIFVRRSKRYWSAIPSDLVIEQVLMASLMNIMSGLTYGR